MSVKGNTLWLSDATLSSFKSLKASSLVRLSKAGLPVPDTCFILNSAFELFYKTYKSQITEILSSVNPKSDVQLEGAQSDIQRIFRTKKMDPDLQKEILEKYAEMGKPFVAVRSANFAEWIEPTVGQKTYLNVKGKRALFDSIRRCWGLFFDTKTLLNIVQAKAKPQVVLIMQKMVISQEGGVALTTYPGNESACLIEAAFGLPAGVTSGIATHMPYPNLIIPLSRKG